jgi:hypothetical protein
MSETEPMTTAQAVGSYYRELIAEGIPERVAGEMALRASFDLTSERLAVKARTDV